MRHGETRDYFAEFCDARWRVDFKERRDELLEDMEKSVNENKELIQELTEFFMQCLKIACDDRQVAKAFSSGRGEHLEVDSPMFFEVSRYMDSFLRAHKLVPGEFRTTVIGSRVFYTNKELLPVLELLPSAVVAKSNAGRPEGVRGCAETKYST